MKLTNELIEKAKTAKSAEELLEIAKAENIELAEEEAAKAFAELHRSGELSDNELDNVAGGCGDEPAPPVFNVRDRVYFIEVDGEKTYGTIEYITHVSGDCYCYYVRRDGQEKATIGLGAQLLTKVN
ncbi:MAG: hypothetical protein ACI3X1_07660 [Eubacteriales bacterium]